MSELTAADTSTAQEQAQPTDLPMTTDQAREFLIGFMNEHFTDRTFHGYIRGVRDAVNLAGDFAWQMATALRKIGATPCAMCHGTGSVGHAQDDYFSCPDCTPEAAQPQAASQSQPFGYISKAEAEKLSDKRLGGLGMMISKDPAEHRMAIYLAPPAPTAQPLTDAVKSLLVEVVDAYDSDELEYIEADGTTEPTERFKGIYNRIRAHLAGDAPAGGA